MSEKRRDNKGRILHSGESQRSDGTYMFRYIDSSGQRRTVYSGKLVATDKPKGGKRAAEALRDIEKKIRKDLDDQIKTADAAATTVDDLFKQFMDIRRDLKETSRCCYLDIYRKHIKPSLGSKTVDHVKPTDIQKLYQTMVTEGGVKPTTAQKAHSILYQLFENAVMDHILRTNPASKAFHNFRKTQSLISKSREPLTTEQQARFIDYIYHSRQYGRMANLFTVLLGTGMRIGEALGLRWCDCDFEEEVIRVTHTLLYKAGEDGNYRYRISTPKTSAGFREIPMLEDVKAALQREREKPKSQDEKFSVDGYSDFVFLNHSGKVYTPSFIYDTIQGITASYNKAECVLAREAGRTPCYLPKISAHILRHTFCTRMCEGQANIKVLQDIMGHQDIRTTMETYAKAMKDKKRETIQALNGAFKIS